METYAVKYSAKTPMGSRIIIETEISPDLNQMIAWMMDNHPESTALIEAYKNIREQANARRSDARANLEGETK
jgi:hypothetical protein